MRQDFLDRSNDAIVKYRALRVVMVSRAQSLLSKITLHSYCTRHTPRNDLLEAVPGSTRMDPRVEGPQTPRTAAMAREAMDCQMALRRPDPAACLTPRTFAAHPRDVVLDRVVAIEMRILPVRDIRIIDGGYNVLRVSPAVAGTSNAPETAYVAITRPRAMSDVAASRAQNRQALGRETRRHVSSALIGRSVRKLYL